MIKKSYNIQVFRQRIDILNVLFIFLTIIVCLFVFKLSLYHNSHFRYDESNTLNISHQNPDSILRILSNEQNFPLYYLLCHLVLIIFNSDRVVVFLNFIIWIFSIILFAKVINLYIENKRSIYLFTLLYSMVPSFIWYSYYIRVYGLLSVFILLNIYFNFKYFKMKHANSLFAQGFVLIILSLLHPLSIFQLLITGITGFFVSKKEHILLFLISLLIPLDIFLYEIFMKNNVFNIYFGFGVEYLNSTSEPLVYISNAILHNSSYIGVLFVLLGLITNIIFLVKSFFPFKYLYLFLSVVFLCVIGLFFNKHLGNQHIIIFIPTFLLLIFLSINSFPNKIKIFVMFILFYLLINSFYSFSRAFWDGEATYTTLCNTLRSISGETIIVDYTTLNATSYCKNGNDSMVLWDNNNLVSLDSLKMSDILTKQAILGGSKTLASGGSCSLWFNNLILKDDVYIVMDVNFYKNDNICNLESLKGYKYKEYIYPSIYHLVKVSNI